MTDPTAPEPTMEEILASIRRIISEDDAPAADAEHAADAAPAGGGDADDVFEAHDAHEDRPANETKPAHEDDVLELTQKVEAPPAPKPSHAEPAADETLGDLDVFTAAPEPVTAPPPRRIAPEPAEDHAAWSAAGAEVDEEEPLIADHKADAAASHFGSLSKSLAMPSGGRTLEDLVRELLRPLLKEWLDQHLQQIVETRVQDEVERISRRRVY